MPAEAAQAAAPPRIKQSSRARLLLVAATFIAGWLIAKYTGLLERADAASIREAIEGAGAWGVAMFVVAFSVGELLHIPGMVFVGAATLAYGKMSGFAVSMLAAVASVSLSFIVVRAIGGKAFAQIDRAFVKKMLARLDARPISTVIILRLVLWIAPALNYGLALTSIRFRDYVIGSAIGLVPPVLLMSLFFDWLIAYFGV